MISVYGIILTFLSFRLAGAFFSDTANSTTNTFAAAAEFPTATPTPAQVVINEVFQTGNASGEWVELYNTTDSPIDVSGWSIADNEEPDPFPSVSPIPANGYAVVIPDESTVSVPGTAITIQLSDTEIGGSLAQAGDKAVLMDSSATTVDAMSWGTNTDAFPTPVPSPAAGQSMARIPNGTDTGTAADWTADETPSLGVSND